MDRKRWIELLGSAILFIVLATVVSACSKEEDDYEASVDVSPVVNNVPSMNCSFLGVWTVNDIVADTVRVDVCLGQNEDIESGNNIGFYGFPYQAIVDQLYPGKKIESVTSEIASWLPLRYVGHSDKAFYFEFQPIKITVDSRCISYYVKLDDGKIVGISLWFVANKFKAIIDTNGESFSCWFPIDNILYYEESEGCDPPLMEKKPDPEMKLKYTSIKRIEGGTVGN